MENALFYLPKEQVGKYVEINKRVKSEDLVYGKHNFNRYGTALSFVSSFLTEFAGTDKMYKMLNELNNEINELKSDCLARQEEDIDDVIQNALLVYKNQLKFFDAYILKSKQRTPAKRISAGKLFKQLSSSSPLSVGFFSQDTIAERVKSKPRERKETGTGLKINKEIIN